MNEIIDDEPLMTTNFWELALKEFGRHPDTLHEMIALLLASQRLINQRLLYIEQYIVAKEENK